MTPTRCLLRLLLLGASLCAGCPPDVHTLCEAGEAYCVAKTDGRCDQGTRKLALESTDDGRLAYVRLGKGNDGTRVSVCCPEDEATPYCEFHANGRELEIVQRPSAIGQLFSDADRSLQLATGAQLLVRDFTGIFASLDDTDLPSLPPLPESRALKSVFALEANWEIGPDILLSLPSPYPLANEATRTLVYALRVRGWCNSEQGCTLLGVEATYDDCADLRESNELPPDICEPQNNVQAQLRTLLCDATPCQWVLIDPNEYETTADGRIHIKPPFAGLYTAVAE